MLEETDYAYVPNALVSPVRVHEPAADPLTKYLFDAPATPASARYDTCHARWRGDVSRAAVREAKTPSTIARLLATPRHSAIKPATGSRLGTVQRVPLAAQFDEINALF